MVQPTPLARFLPAPSFPVLFLGLLAAKLAGVAVLGITYEMDTVTYLATPIPFHHPPLYAILVALSRAVRPDAWSIVVAQSVVFSAAAAAAVRRFAAGSGTRFAVAAIVAVEPTSTFFCANLMSESLYAAALLACFTATAAYLDARAPATRLVWVAALGAGLALLYATRLAGLFAVPFFLAVLLVRTRPVGRAVVHAVLVVVVMQVCLVPAKLAYLDRYGAYTINLFTGANLWNSASVLYADSSIRRSPQTEFERFLASRPADPVTTADALDGIPIHGADSAFTRYVERRPMTVDERRAFERSLGATATRLILENPIGYLERFVIPNLWKPLGTNELIPITPEAARAVRLALGHERAVPVTYKRLTWWIATAAWLALVALAAVPRLRDARAVALLAYVGYTWAVTGLVASISLRYLLVLVPLLPLAGAVLWERGTAASADARPDERLEPRADRRRSPA